MGDLCVDFNERASTLVGYIDFQKAFDKVSVPKLLYKIDILGIGGKLKSCLESFLTGRSQMVKVECELSRIQKHHQWCSARKRLRAYFVCDLYKRFTYSYAPVN